MGKKHHVRSHFWQNGILNTVEHFFDTLEEAMTHADESDAHTIKIYDPEGNLLDSKVSTAVPDQISVRGTYS